MNDVNIYNIIHFDEHSITPKYLQLANSIVKGIADGLLKKDTILPSINDLSFELEISRNTAEKSYKRLKKMNLIQSVPGKGYFISGNAAEQSLRIFLLFNKLSSHKKIIYDSFVKVLGETAAIDLYIYNNDFNLFRKLLTERIGQYSYYVIIPHFLEGGDRAFQVINEIPKERLVLMSRQVSGVDGTYAAVYEDFATDIYGALEQALERLKKYSRLNIIFPDYTYHPKEILRGFQHFCQDYAFGYDVIRKPEQLVVEKGTVYISLMEDDLVPLLNKVLQTKLRPGKDVGIISYNETPIKQFILDGITTISADFSMMGERAARMILDRTAEKVAVPFTLTLRSSL